MTSVQASIDAARLILAPRPVKASALGLLGATAMAATTAVLLAGVIILGPGVAIEDPALDRTTAEAVR